MKNKNILIVVVIVTLSVFGLAYAQDQTKSNPTKPTTVSATIVAIQEEITPTLYKSINEITTLKPNQVGIDKKVFYQQAQAIQQGVLPYPKDSPEVQKAKNAKIGLLEFKGSPVMTILRLEQGITWERHPKGAIGIESAIFADWDTLTGGVGVSKEEMDQIKKERQKNRKILWRWDVPKEFVNGTLSGTSGGNSYTTASDPKERFLPILLGVPKMEAAPKGILTLYGFDSMKGKVWERDILPLLDKNMSFSKVGSVPDGSFTIMIASSSQEEAEKGTGGIRIIVFDAKGKITSVSDIKGVSAGQFYRNNSLNSFRLGGFIMSIEGKKYKPQNISQDSSFDFFITKQGAVVRLVDEKGETIRGGITICADDKLAYSFSTQSDVAWDLSAVSSR
jgi:hypothetical protein